MREEADEMYPEKEPDEVAVAEIMASPAYWNLSASRSMQEQAAKFFLSHGFGLDGTGSLLADGLVYTVEPVTPRNQEVQS
jgi:hypothetical protein